MCISIYIYKERDRERDRRERPAIWAAGGPRHLAPQLT